MNVREIFLQRAATALLTVLGIVTASPGAAQTAWKPDKVVEFLVGSSPGGGNDKTARTLQKIWQDNKWLDNVVNAGTVRILGVSSAQRSAALPNVPTLRDQGYDHVMGNWAAVVGPRGLGPAQVAYWEDLLERTAHHPDWKGLVEANALEFDFRKSRPTREWMAKDYDPERAMLTELGMVTKP